MGIRSALQAPPVGDSHVIGMRLLHLCQVCPELIQPAPQILLDIRALCKASGWQGIMDIGNGTYCCSENKSA